MQDKLDHTEDAALQFQALADAFDGLDLEDPKHRRAHQALSYIRPSEGLLTSYQHRSFGKYGAIAVKVFERRSPNGQSNFVAVILHGPLVDHLHMQQCSMEWREQDDGSLRIAFTDASIGMGGGFVPPKTHVFTVTPTGFERVGSNPASGLFGRP